MTHLIADTSKAKDNLIAHLKHCFPSTKFSVRKRGYDAYNVYWKDGASEEAVTDVCKLFEELEGDSTGNYVDFVPTDFTRTYGGFKYVFVYRSISEERMSELEGFLKAFEDKHGYWSKKEIALRILRKSDITGRIVGINELEGSVSDFTPIFE